jgi:hypothetical protein
VEEANRRTENHKAENSERVEADATALRSSHAATIARLEEANRRNEELEENILELKCVEADATALRSSHAATVARLEEATGETSQEI